MHGQVCRLAHAKTTCFQYIGPVGPDVCNGAASAISPFNRFFTADCLARCAHTKSIDHASPPALACRQAAGMTRSVASRAARQQVYYFQAAVPRPPTSATCLKDQSFPNKSCAHSFVNTANAKHRKTSRREPALLLGRRRQLIVMGIQSSKVNALDACTSRCTSMPAPTLAQVYHRVFIAHTAHQRGATPRFDKCSQHYTLSLYE